MVADAIFVGAFCCVARWSPSHRRQVAARPQYTGVRFIDRQSVAVGRYRCRWPASAARLFACVVGFARAGRRRYSWPTFGLVNAMAKPFLTVLVKGSFPEAFGFVETLLQPLDSCSSIPIADKSRTGAMTGSRSQYPEPGLLTKHQQVKRRTYSSGNPAVTICLCPGSMRRRDGSFLFISMASRRN